MHLRYPSIVAFALAFAASARADVVTLLPAKDNTLYEHPTDDLSNGAGRHMFVGRTGQSPGEDKRRALVEFDLSSAVPAGSTVNSVSLRLYMSRTQVGTTPVSIHEVDMEWGEAGSNASGGEGAGTLAETGDATWLFAFYPTVTWFSPGGDFDGSPSATTSVGGDGYYTWSGAALRDDVQEWVDDMATNHGWVLIGDEVSDPSAKRFDTREENDASKRPMLTVDFTPPGNTGACCQGPSCSLTTQAECSALGGAWQGVGTDCSMNPCGATGACCLPAGGCVVTTALDCAAQGGVYQGDMTVCVPGLCPVALEPFVDALPLPQPAQPTTGQIGGQAEYDLAITQFQQQLHRDLPPTTLWGYGGSYPGPTIEASRDEPVIVRWINDLRDSQGNLRTDHFLPVDTCLHGPAMAGPTPRTVTHLHGGHVPADSDGYPEDTILPGQMQEYTYPNDQPPATLWYHDHALGITRLNVIMGMAGFYLLRDPFELALGLPEGEFEVPLAIQDRTFRADGSIEYPASWEDAYFGDAILVNGKVWPFLEVRRGKYRFRMLNGSNSRTYTLALSNGMPFVQIGTDGGLMPAPLTAQEITLSPGERADVIVDFEGLPNGTEILLQNSAPAPWPGNPGIGVVPDVMKLVVQGGGGFTDPVPQVLRPVEELLRSAAVREREFILRKEQGDPCTGFRWLINDLDWDAITEFPVLDTIEVWSFVNPTNVVHPMHMHLVLFQVLDRQDFMIVAGEVVPLGNPEPPDPSEEGWKDTVRGMPGKITRVIARFEDYAGFYSYHCHILEHEDHEMMRQFQSLESPGTPFCYGAACPCGNDNPQAGCQNSTGKGVVLYSTGTASVAADDLVLTAVNMPASQFGIPFMGEIEIAPTPLGAGLRCIGFPLHRLFPIVQADPGGTATIGPGIVGLSQALPPVAHIVSGSTWGFQLWYRDPVGSPCGAQYSASNGIRVTFAP